MAALASASQNPTTTRRRSVHQRSLPNWLPQAWVRSITGLAEREIGFRSLQEAIDTTTPGGKLVFHVFAALAEFERDLIRERTSAGLAAARARGRRGGRPSVLSGHKLKVAQEMYGSGEYTVAAIAQTLGVSRASVYRQLRSPTAGPTEARPEAVGPSS